MENLLVALIVLLAVLYMGRRVWQTVQRRSRGTCSCGCSGCSAQPGAKPAGRQLTASPCSGCQHPRS